MSLNLRSRTFAYGSTRRVKIHSIDASELWSVVAYIDLDDETEAFLSIDFAAAAGEVGDLGVITFQRGGPTGGHWVFTKGGGS